jgi:hypothetical protein
MLKPVISRVWAPAAGPARPMNDNETAASTSNANFLDVFMISLFFP